MLCRTDASTHTQTHVACTRTHRNNFDTQARRLHAHRAPCSTPHVDHALEKKKRHCQMRTDVATNTHGHVAVARTHRINFDIRALPKSFCSMMCASSIYVACTTCASSSYLTCMHATAINVNIDTTVACSLKKNITTQRNPLSGHTTC